MAITWSPYKLYTPGATLRVRFGIDCSPYRTEASVNVYAQYNFGDTVPPHRPQSWDYEIRVNGSVQRSHHFDADMGTESQQWIGSLTTVRGDYGQSVQVNLQIELTSDRNPDKNHWSVSQNVTFSKTVPDSPSSLSYTDLTRDSVTLAWTRSSDDGGSSIDADRVQIGREGEFTGDDLVYTNEDADSPLRVSELDPSTRYRARVSSHNAQGWGGWRYTGYFETLPDGPAAPSGLTVTRVSDTQQNLTWVNHATSGAPYDNVRVERWDGSWKVLATLGGTVNTYSDTTTTANKSYRYRVVAINTGGGSASDTATIYTTPAAPTGATVSRGPNGLLITWSPQAGYAVEHEVWNADGGTWDSEPLGRAAEGVSEFVDTQPNPLTTHRYRVRAVSPNGLTSAYALTQTIDIVGPPNPPILTGPNSAQDATEPITLRWRHEPVDYSTQTRYRIWWRYEGDTAWHDLPVVDSSDEFAVMPPGTWVNGRTVEWQAATWGAYPAFSPRSATGAFPTSAPPQGVITYPNEGEIHRDPALTVTWTFSDPEGQEQAGWEVILRDADDGVVETRTGTGTSTRAVTLRTPLGPFTSWSVDLRVRDQAGAWSGVYQVEFAVEYTAPAQPQVEAVWQPQEGTVQVAVANNPWSPADRQALEDAIHAWQPTATVVWATDPPQDLGVIWANPQTGLVTEWGTGYCTPGGSAYDRAREALIDALNAYAPGVPVEWADLPPNYQYYWTGEPDQSPSVETLDGQVQYTNLIPNPRGRDTSGTVVVRENLVPNPSFEYGLDGWTTPRGMDLTQIVDSRLGMEGQYVAQVTPNGGAWNAGSAVFNTPAGSGMAVAEGDVISVGGRVVRSAASSPASVRLLILGYGSTGSYEGVVASINGVPTLAGSPSSFNQAKIEGVTIPAGVVEVRLGWYMDSGFDPDNWTSGSLLFDAHQVVKGATLPPYADGDSTSSDTDLTWGWAATPGNSVSQLTAPGLADINVPAGYTGYYSTSRDAIALTSTGQAYITFTGLSTPNASTMLAEIVDTSDGQPVTMDLYRLSPKGGAGLIEAAPGETIRSGIPSTSTGAFVWLVPFGSMSGRTVYFRAALIDGTDTYDGEWFDGHTPDRPRDVLWVDARNGRAYEPDPGSEIAGYATYDWGGNPGESTSTESVDGVVVRENLCPTPSFEHGLGSWVQGGDSLLSLETAAPIAGTQSLRWERAATTSNAYAQIEGVPLSGVGEALYLRFLVRPEFTGTMRVLFGTTGTGGYGVFDLPVEAGVEQAVDLQYQTATGMPPSLRCWIGQGGGMGVTGDAAVIDQVQVSYGQPPGDYFDGDTPDQMLYIGWSQVTDPPVQNAGEDYDQALNGGN